MIEILTPTPDGSIASQQVQLLYQWVIVRDNCETYVTWAETKRAALDQFHAEGHHDEWKILKKCLASQ
jgi:hypothetical protein